jgi:IS605 OrfB family transposase
VYAQGAMDATFTTRLRDEASYPALTAIAQLFGHVERCLYVDLAVRGRPVAELKREYLPRFGLTARQFNAILATVQGKVSAARESQANRAAGLRAAIDATEKAIGKLRKKRAALGRRPKRQRFVHDAARAAERARLAFRLHGKRRRLARLRTRLAAVEADRASGRVRLCFGSRRLFAAQFDLRDNGYAGHAAWRHHWRQARSAQFFCLGSHDETAGNQTCTHQPDGRLRLRVPPALATQFGTWLLLPPVSFPYGQAAVDAALGAGRAVSYRFVRRTKKGGDVWYVHATVGVTPAEVSTDPHRGAVGVDLNPAHVDVAEVDRFGNPVGVRRLPVAVQGRSTAQVSAALGDAVAAVVAQARTAGTAVVVERLDFREKKARLREASDRQARLLSSFAYRKFDALLRSRAAREGVQVIRVNAAHTSVIGFAKFGPGYGLSSHAAAAVAIARRGLRFSERLRSRSALPLPARNRGRHVWSDWRRSARWLRALARGRRPSEGVRGGGGPPSVAAPAVTQGPPRDRPAADPGCDPPAQSVGSAVRPAS